MCVCVCVCVCVFVYVCVVCVCVCVCMRTFFYFSLLNQDVFRKYPNQYEGMIGELCENLDSLDEPEAR